MEIAFEVFCKGLDGSGFSQARRPFHKQVTVCEQGDQQAIHEFFLPDYPFG